MEKDKANKHLTYEDRTYIEIGLNQGRNFTEIGEDLEKDRTTISREIKRHILKKTPSSFNNSGNLCKHKYECKRFDCTKEKECYEEDICVKLLKRPYVCNGCDEKSKCRKIKYYYYAKYAHNEYEENKKESRQGVNLTKEEIYDLDNLITPLMKEKNQTIAHIYANHPDEIWFSRKTMYNYIDLGIFKVRNIDLPRKVKYKKRKNNDNNKRRRETVIRQGRTYQEFEEYIEEHKNASIVEMDTVEGKKGGKVFLTLLFRKSKFMLIFLLEEKTTKCVTEKFKYIQEILGKELYKRTFEVVLTDNGSEFFDPLSIEKFLETKEVVAHVYYCDPGASWQKGSIEKNHEYIRYILPKGTSFNELTNDKVNLIMSHINSISRDTLEGKNPYEEVQFVLDEEIINKIGNKKIAPDEVILSPKLLKGGDNK